VCINVGPDKGNQVCMVRLHWFKKGKTAGMDHLQLALDVMTKIAIKLSDGTLAFDRKDMFDMRDKLVEELTGEPVEAPAARQSASEVKAVRKRADATKPSSTDPMKRPAAAKVVAVKRPVAADVPTPKAKQVKARM
jgi:hypothetical protein